ncbi:MAG: efflux RND transporter periplasmic adaptor subunit [Gammaproteobacteria bacterium]|nr:efflux RND transporter periplasmic adaptor subunit [Gammaproteobacteria bacterium]
MTVKLPVFFMTLFLLSCDSTKSPENAVDTYEVVSPLVQDMPYSHEYVAEIHSVKYVEVRSRVKGYIEKIYVDEGKNVKEDQLLFALNSEEYQKEVQKANAVYKNAVADLKAAEVDLANVKRLVAKDIVSTSELAVALAKTDALKADVEEAIANKDKAVLELTYTQIKAPYHGVINRIHNKVGSLIDEGAMLTSISESSEVFAYFNLSETDYLNYISAGGSATKTVNLKLANNSLYGYEGKLETVESEFDRLTGNIAFRARFPNPDGLLKHGSHGKIIVNKILDNALLVPQKSTLEIQDKLYVFVVREDGTLSQRNITQRMRFPDYFAIDSGLERNEKFLLEGVEKVKDGVKVKVSSVDISQAMASSHKN